MTEFFLLLGVIYNRGPGKKPADESPDRHLLQKAKEGDRSAFDGLYNKYKKPIFNYIYRMIGDRAVAEELAQETFVRVYTNIQGYRPVGKVSSWIYMIAGNLAKNELRNRERRRTVSLEARLTDDEKITLENILANNDLKPDEAAENKELKEKIKKVMEQLSANHKEVIVLCDIQGLSYEDAAEVMMCSVGTVASRLSRARKAFIKLFKDNFGERV